MAGMESLTEDDIVNKRRGSDQFPYLWHIIPSWKWENDGRRNPGLISAYKLVIGSMGSSSIGIAINLAIGGVELMFIEILPRVINHAYRLSVFQ